MRLRLYGLALLTTALALNGACSSATVADASVDDAGVRLDAAPRPDALPRTDAEPADPDTGMHPDAGDPDAAAPDATPPDADVDAGPPDAGDPCGPLPRVTGAERMTSALSRWLERCNPELSAAETLTIATVLSGVTSEAFANTNLAYDEASAGACGCAIETASCEVLRSFRAIPSCNAAFVATATTGDACGTDLDCPSEHVCNIGNIATARGVALGRPPVQCGGGQCIPLAQLGEPCSGGNFEIQCVPGTYCNYELGTPVCATNALAGEDCSGRACLGDYNDVLILPPNECVFTKAGATCRARGRGPLGTCTEGSCHDLYRCQENGVCFLPPGDSQLCAVPYDVAVADPGEAAEIISAAQYACRVPIIQGPNAGYWCTQTGTTTGRANCQPLAGEGGPCGIGQGLAPACSGGAYCAGIDSETLAPVTGLCVPRLTDGSTCTPSRFSANDPCEPGFTCYDDGKRTPFCTDICSLIGG